MVPISRCSLFFPLFSHRWSLHRCFLPRAGIGPLAPSLSRFEAEIFSLPSPLPSLAVIAMSLLTSALVGLVSVDVSSLSPFPFHRGGCPPSSLFCPLHILYGFLPPAGARFLPTNEVSSCPLWGRGSCVSLSPRIRGLLFFSFFPVRQVAAYNIAFFSCFFFSSSGALTRRITGFSS